jgi:hypothetical protein
VKRGHSSTKLQRTACEILLHLKKHPEAKDTIEGIARWWFRRESCQPTPGEVKRAVSFLLSKDLILETQRMGSTPYYGLNPRKLEEISTIVNSS